MSLSPINSTPVAAPAASKLTVKKQGQVILPELTLEIKTCVSHKPLEFREVALQLWVSQTSELLRAYHYKGTFQRPEVADVAASIKKWEERNQTDFRKLAALIKKILDVMEMLSSNIMLREIDWLFGRLTGEESCQRTCILNSTRETNRSGDQYGIYYRS